MPIEEIKKYARDLKNRVDRGLREGTIRPAKPVFLYGKDNTITVSFSFSYWIMPDGTVEYRSKLAGEHATANEKHRLLPPPPVLDAPGLDNYVKCCEGLLGLPHLI